MIASKYALNILNKMFRTEGAAGETYEEELATLKQELDLVQMTELPGEPKWGIQAKTYHNAFKTDNYEQGKEYNKLVEKRMKANSSRWYSVESTPSENFTYSFNGKNLTDSQSGWYLVLRDEPVDFYPRNSYLALFTQMPNADGTGYVEPGEGTTYMRINLHWSILNGTESLNTAAPDAENNNISTITNKEIIMFPEVSSFDWGTIIGFGVFEEEEVGEGTPVVWGRLKNENGIEASIDHVPLFRKGNFKVTLS